jgi:hypothetical protein
LEKKTNNKGEVMTDWISTGLLRKQIKDHCYAGKPTDKLAALIAQYPHKVLWSVVKGQSKGVPVEGRPFVIGTYSTMNWGDLQTYRPSSCYEDALVVIDGTEYVVVVNRNVMGNAHVPSKCWWVAVEVIPEPVIVTDVHSTDDGRINARDEFSFHVLDKPAIMCAQINVDWWKDDKNFTYDIPIGYTVDQFAQFLANLNFQYENGYGTQYVKGTIWYTDGTWSERAEYDGSEWWKHITVPVIPPELQKQEG